MDFEFDESKYSALLPSTDVVMLPDDHRCFDRVSEALIAFEVEARRYSAMPKSFRLEARSRLHGDVDGDLHGLAGDFHLAWDTETAFAPS